MNRYIIFTSHGRRIFVTAAYSFEAEHKAKKLLAKNERVSSWSIAGTEKPNPWAGDVVLPR